MTVPAHAIDASDALFFPTHASAIDVSSTDADLTMLFPRGYATRLHVGTGGTVTVDTAGSSNVQFTAATGTYLYGIFTKVYHTGTNASKIVAQGN